MAMKTTADIARIGLLLNCEGLNKREKGIFFRNIMIYLAGESMSKREISLGCGLARSRVSVIIDDMHSFRHLIRRRNNARTQNDRENDLSEV